MCLSDYLMCCYLEKETFLLIYVRLWLPDTRQSSRASEKSCAPSIIYPVASCFLAVLVWVFFSTSSSSSIILYSSPGRISQAQQIPLTTERVPFGSARESQFYTIRKRRCWHTCHRVCTPAEAPFQIEINLFPNAVKRLKVTHLIFN